MVAVTAQDGASGRAVCFSPSRGRLWRNAEGPAHWQTVTEARMDCDSDVVLYRVEPAGDIACHMGRESCFYRRRVGADWRVADLEPELPKEVYRK